MSDLIPLLQKLVRINSVNPDIAADGAGEAEIAAFIAEWGKQNGLDLIVQDAAPNRPNVILIARGTGGGKSLMFNGHADTVGVAEMDDPFNPLIEDGKLYGRGSYDMKASLAACMISLLNAKSMNLRGDVMLSAVIDEEYASLGTAAIIEEWENWKADAVIVTEPTELEISIAHKGFVWLEVETFGVSAHGSRPHLGVDAITKMGKVLTRVDALDQHLRANPRHDLLLSGSLHASIISGGEAISMYPAYSKLILERRTLPDEPPELVQEQIQDILNELAANDSDFKAQVKTTMARGAFNVHPQESIVQIVQKQAQSVLGGDVPLVGSTFWMDAALFSEHGIPTLAFGPLGAGAHAKVEWIDLQSVEQCVDIYSETAREFCS